MIEQVIEIHPDAKYIIVIDEKLHDPKIVSEKLSDWWEDESATPFLLMPNTMKLVRVDKDKE